MILHRQKVSTTAVQGELSLDGSHYGWTLERPYMDPEHACIPVGTYPLSMGWSNHFQCDMVHIDNVPGRAGILIHGGNHVADSLGCIMVFSLSFRYGCPCPTHSGKYYLNHRSIWISYWWG